MIRKILISLVILIVLSVLALPVSFVIVLFSDVANTTFISASDGKTGPAFEYFVKTLKNILVLIWIIYPLLHFTIIYTKKRFFRSDK